MSDNGKLRILLFLGAVILAVVTGGFTAALAFNGRLSSLERAQTYNEARLMKIEGKLDQILERLPAR